MDEQQISLTIRLADKTRRAEVTVPRSLTAYDLIRESCRNWHLPANTEYQLVNVSTGRQLPPSAPLSSDLVENGHELELQPFIVAGAATIAPSLRTNRVLADVEALEQLCIASDGVIALNETVGDPPRVLVLSYHCRGIERLAGESPVYRNHHRLEVQLGANYPLEPPRVRFLTPIAHPHVWRWLEVCSGDRWQRHEPLTSLVLRLGGLIQWDPRLLDFSCPANGDAAAWARRHVHELPVGVSGFGQMDRGIKQKNQPAGVQWWSER